MEATYEPYKPTCRICGLVLAPGTLATHEVTMHPKAPKAPAAVAKPRTCYRVKCLEVYGPKGHVPGLEGPHAY